MREVYVGMSFDTRENWEEWVETPKAPKNYKDPVKIQEYINDKVNELKATSNEHPLAGHITRWALQDGDNEPAHGSDVVDLLSALTDIVKEASEPVMLIGLDINHGLRVAAYETMRNGYAAPRWVFFQYMQGDVGVVTEDPLSAMMVGEKTNMTKENLLEFINVDVAGLQVYELPHDRMNLARRLYGLYV